jgi:putative NADPH-quinone reductase
MAWGISMPSSLRGWFDYVLVVGIPIMVMLAVKDRVFSVADSIYDGRNGS